MVYKFKIVSDEVDNFKLEILIDGDDKFMRLRNAILDAAGYTKSQPDSFFICDNRWEKEKEVVQVDMGVDRSTDIMLMDETSISELVEDEGQKLIFVFDYMTERSFFMELKEIEFNKSLKDPVCTRKEGEAPAQDVDVENFIDKVIAGAGTKVDDIDEDFYGDSYDQEELDQYTGGYDDEL